MKTTHTPAIVEVLASRVSGLHFPSSSTYNHNGYMPLIMVDSDDELQGNPEDPLVQLAAAAAVEHKHLLARERMIKVQQGEWELELRKKRDEAGLDKERQELQNEKAKLKEGAAELHRRWTEFEEIQRGFREPNGPPTELARLAGVSPSKQRRAAKIAVSVLSSNVLLQLTDTFVLLAPKARPHLHPLDFEPALCFCFYRHAHRRRRVSAFGNHGLHPDPCLGLVDRKPQTPL
jgi:hypothetical protein